MILDDHKILIDVQNLSKHFCIEKKIFQKNVVLKANKNINLSIFKGETLAIVGGSGSGKSTLGQLILQLQKPTSGHVFYKKNEKIIFDLTMLNKKEEKIIRKDLQIIFQDPFSSLNPRLKISDIIGEGLLIHKMVKNKKDPIYKTMILEIMEKCEIDFSFYDSYPHQLSGGQRQRVAIARALIIKPEFVVCDEIVSALDVSTQIKILELLNNLKKHFKLTIFFITHDLGVAHYLSDRICVMHLGNLIEIAPTSKIFKNPFHPYTKELLNAIPNLKDKNKLKDKKIIYETDRFNFLFQKNQKDLDWLEVEPNHFISCTLKNKKKDIKK